MRTFAILLFLLPLVAQAHPGIGLVKDSRGNLYYTDLTQVWKIKDGKKSLAVPNVHTHELYIDENDRLFGEGGYYDDRIKKFYHYQWVLHPNGKTDTVTGMKEAYVTQDFSLARDKQGNGYYVKRFLAPHTDTNHIYQVTPDGKESIFATGNFRQVNWLHPQEDGSVLFVSANAIYRANRSGHIQLVKEQIGNAKPSYKFYRNHITIWGVWQDREKNVYAAVFSDQVVRKIAPDGSMTDIYRSKDNWTPLHGVFDNAGRLWVYEGSDENEVRVTLAVTSPNLQTTPNQLNQNSIIYFLLIGSAIGIVLVYAMYRYLHRRSANATQVPLDRTIK